MFNKIHKPEKLVAGIISFKINQGFLPLKKSKNFIMNHQKLIILKWS